MMGGKKREEEAASLSSFDQKLKKEREREKSGKEMQFLLLVEEKPNRKSRSNFLCVGENNVCLLNIYVYKECDQCKKEIYK